MGGWPTLPLLAPAFANCGGAGLASGRPLFIDLETTGLAGGAGTYAFLIGVGWFEPPSPEASASQGASFHVRQFVLTSFVGERVLLEELARLGGEAGGVITYNGKTFDLPLIETRFLFHRLPPPFAATPHVDMLHPARRLWSAATGSGRLAAMEQDVLGCTREDDVPGFEIPERYFHFVRSGDARPLAGVLEHTRRDLLSLAMLTARAAQLLDEGAPATRDAREALGLGRLYERAGMVGDARRCFERATILDDADAETAANALRALALSCRRSRQYESAAAAWRRVLEIPGLDSRLAQEAAEALAIHHEHRVRDLHAARSFASLSLQHRTSIGRVTALQYRLARLNRKLSPIPLF